MAPVSPDTALSHDGPAPSALERFKRARTTSPETDASSTDAEHERSAHCPTPNQQSSAVDDGLGSPADDTTPTNAANDLRFCMPQPSDESVDSLIGEVSLHLDDAPVTTLVREIEAWRATQPRTGDTWYLVPASWYASWRARPTLVQPMDLAPLTTNGVLRADLTEGVDYELLPSRAWDALANRYTVRGTLLARSVIAGPGGHARIELFPPRVEFVRCRSGAGGGNGPVVSELPSTTLSAGATLRTLKMRARMLGAVPPSAADADTRFLRVPDSLRAAALAGGGALSAPVLLASDPPVEVVQCSTDDATLAALQLDAPSLLLAVDVRESGVWRFSTETPLIQTRSATRAASGSATTKPPLGLRGIANLGNTCFMNSALQCLSNTPELQQYFQHGVHWEELNADNPLGMGGALATAYGRLVHQLWGAGQSAVVPREFKMALARFAPQFMGYAQQDSQELLAFLLDGLHEDLNRITKKPFIETPDWLGGGDKEMVHFARQQWDLYKARNDSIIVDLFQGQYRSTLVCPACGKVSIKFDPFMYLTLPIPNTRTWRGRVFVVPCDSAAPLVQADVQLPATATVAQLRERVAALTGVDAACLVVGEVWSHHVYRWLADYEPLRDISAGDYIYLWELAEPYTAPKPLRPSGRFSFFSRAERAIADIERSFPAPQPANVALPVYSCIAGSGTYRRTLGEPLGLPFFVSVERAQLDAVDAVYQQVARQYVRFSRAADVEALYREAHAARSGAADDADRATPFRLYFAVPSADEAVHRGDEASDESAETLEDRVERLRDAPWPVLYPGGALFAVWDRDAASVLNPVPANHAWSAPQSMQDADFQRGTAQLSEGRRRAPKLTLDDCLDEFTKSEQLGENDLWYCPACKDFRQATKKFDLWSAPDVLVVHLKRFSAGRSVRDKLDNYIDFPLEGFDLRDRIEGTKMLRALPPEPPTTETRISDTIAVAHDPHDDQVAADEPVYDLYAVDNHFGGLGGGHYTAFAKNPVNGLWYNFDDSSVRPVAQPESVKTSAAYLLFYRRRTTRPIGGKSRDMITKLANQPSAQPEQPERPAITSENYLGDTPLPPSSDESTGASKSVRHADTDEYPGSESDL